MRQGISTNNSPMAAFLVPLLLLRLAAATDMTAFNASEPPWSPGDRRTLVSQNKTFSAGFRPSPSSPGQYIFAVWVTADTTADTFLWYAYNNTDSSNGNRSAIKVDTSAALAISRSGLLSLNGSSGNSLWRPDRGKGPAGGNHSLLLNESGSLTFDGWSSWEHPTDTILAGQAIVENGTTLRSGKYSLMNATSLELDGGYMYCNLSATIVLLTDDGTLQLTSGQPPKLIAADQGKRRLRRLTLEKDGNLRMYSFLARSRRWGNVWQAVQELCTISGTCGRGAICVPVGADTTQCVCPPGFREKPGGAVAVGCEIKKPYGGGGKFIRLDFVSFAGGATTSQSDPGPYMQHLPPTNLDRCESQCRANTSCVAYGYKFSGDRTCYQYTELVDGYWSPATETATYVRVAATETDKSNFTGMTSMIDTVCPVHLSLPIPPKEPKTTLRNIAIIATLFTAELLVGILSFWAFLRKYSQYRDMARTLGLEYLPAGGPRRFSYAELKAATKDFSDIVGRGAYGTVYRGELPDRRAVAVKQLHGVGGGEAEFWAEVTIIARMHHLNLVRMWGFCADKEKRMLVYEYVPNGSLDKHLFHADANANANPDANVETERPLLDLNTRYRIALGVARAVAYLHEECLEWVLHCDIKPENILLEDDFCPKVSDFGLSKLTSKKEKVTMSRIRGTRGYMAPEWVIHREPITAKADVYSFGMVLLEIVSGRRNYGSHQESVGSEDWYFPKWAFEKVYAERKVEDILDPRILDAYDDRESVAMVERMVKTAMWCLQDRADMRPSMGKVAKMLEGTVEITEPSKPTIFCMPDE